MISPIDPTIRAVWRHLGEITSPYFQTQHKFSSSLNHLREKRRLMAASAIPSYNILSIKDGETIDDIRSKAWIVYNRTPIVWSGIGRERPGQVILSSNNPNFFEIRDFIYGKFTINAAFATQDVRQADLFELIYQTRFKPWSRVEFSMSDGGLEQSVLISCDIASSDIESIDQSDETSLGSYWVLPFSLTVSGIFLSPEAINYPKVLRTKGAITVSDIIRVFNEEPLPDLNSSSTELTWTQENQVVKDQVVATRFSISLPNKTEV